VRLCTQRLLLPIQVNGGIAAALEQTQQTPRPVSFGQLPLDRVMLRGCPKLPFGIELEVDVKETLG